jgi:hypothetical protein
MWPTLSTSALPNSTGASRATSCHPLARDRSNSSLKSCTLLEIRSTFAATMPSASPHSQAPIASARPGLLRHALRTRTCASCGTDLDHRTTPRSGFCSENHYQAFRHRRRYQEDPETQRERARAYYWRNREKVLEKAAARRGSTRAPEQTACSECGDPPEGRRRVICGTASCRDRRYARLHPEAYAAREARKVERRRKRRAAARAEGGAA